MNIVDKECDHKYMAIKHLEYTREEIGQSHTSQSENTLMMFARDFK